MRSVDGVYLLRGVGPSLLVPGWLSICDEVLRPGD